VSKITEIVIILVLTKCCVGLTAESSNGSFGEHLPLVYYDSKRKDTMVLPLDLAPLVEHSTYLAFGLDEAKLEHLLAEIQTIGRKAKGRQSFEIICYGIKSKDDCSIAFVAGQGLQITKQNFGTRQFVIVALLWSNTRTFTFLLMENDVFNSLDIDAVDPTLDGKLVFNSFILMDLFFSFASSSSF